ncbi:MAG: hypothetical protein SGI92_04625, partial [Bryobacteraceae bacterium]|nr:hypothetical protein [Bryobacteraceae bacterium]
MRVITEAIETLIGDFIRDRGLVLWFDPEQHYGSIVRGLNSGQDRVLAFDGSFYKLRLEAEPFLRGFDAPKLLVYLPIAWEDAKDPLAEMLAMGVDLRPGVSGSRNTRLAVVARKALKGRVADARLEDLDRQIEQGGLTLAELEELVVGDGAFSLPTALAVLFGTALIEEAALDFLAHPERDAELVARNGMADWSQALGALYGLSAEAGASPVALRKLLARQALTCELMETLGADVPEALQRLVSAADSQVARRGAELSRGWRNRRDLAASYPAVSAEVATSLHLDSIDFSDAVLE